MDALTKICVEYKNGNFDHVFMESDDGLHGARVIILEQLPISYRGDYEAESIVKVNATGVVFVGEENSILLLDEPLIDSKSKYVIDRIYFDNQDMFVISKIDRLLF